MNYGHLSKWVRDGVEELVAMGVSREVAERELKGVEWAAVQDLTETQRDNQLLLNFDQYGSKALAERHGVTDRTIREWRQQALNRKANRRSIAA